MMNDLVKFISPLSKFQWWIVALRHQPVTITQSTKGKHKTYCCWINAVDTWWCGRTVATQSSRVRFLGRDTINFEIFCMYIFFREFGCNFWVSLVGAIIMCVIYSWYQLFKNGFGLGSIFKFNNKKKDIAIGKLIMFFFVKFCFYVLFSVCMLVLSNFDFRFFE